MQWDSPQDVATTMPQVFLTVTALQHITRQSQYLNVDQDLPIAVQIPLEK